MVNSPTGEVVGSVIDVVVHVIANDVGHGSSIRSKKEEFLNEHDAADTGDTDPIQRIL